MEFWQFMSIPSILFVVVVAPIWIVMHYRSVNRSSRSLNREDLDRIEQMLLTVDRLSERIDTLESILDGDHADWRGQASRQGSAKPTAMRESQNDA